MHKSEEQTAGDTLLSEFKPASEKRLLQFEIIFCKDSTSNRSGLSNNNNVSLTSWILQLNAFIWKIDSVFLSFKSFINTLD